MKTIWKGRPALKGKKRMSKMLEWIFAILIRLAVKQASSGNTKMARQIIKDMQERPWLYRFISWREIDRLKRITLT